MSRLRLLSVSCVSAFVGVAFGANISKRPEDSEYSRWITMIKRTFTPERQGGGDGLSKMTLGALPLPIVSAARTDNVPMMPPSRPTSSPQNRSDQIMKYGFPGFDNIRSYGDFVISHDNKNRTARWVFEHLTRDRVKSRQGIDREKSLFSADTSIHSYFRATNEDYRNSGYDRGHLAAAANHRGCQKDMDETFLLSNISPQVGVGFNRGAWNQLEKYVRLLTKHCPNVYVCTGPLYLPRPENGKMYIKYEVIGRNNVAVPTHFFKIVVAEHQQGALEMMSFVMPNADIGDDVDLKKYLVPVDSIERASGLLFFEKIPRTSFIRLNGM